MKKLRLDDLAVESFETTETETAHGTVKGNQIASVDYTCLNHDTCYNDTCRATCRATCPGKQTCDASCNCTDPNVECGGGNLCKQSGSCIQDTELYTVPVLH